MVVQRVDFPFGKVYLQVPTVSFRQGRNGKNQRQRFRTKKKSELDFSGQICNPQEFEGWPLTEWIVVEMMLISYWRINSWYMSVVNGQQIGSKSSIGKIIAFVDGLYIRILTNYAYTMHRCAHQLHIKIKLQRKQETNQISIIHCQTNDEIVTTATTATTSLWELGTFQVSNPKQVIVPGNSSGAQWWL